MLVLLSFALVLAATVLLVLGLLADDGLTLIYLSIACSVAAAVVLIVALRRNKPRVEAKSPPEPLLVGGAPPRAFDPAPGPAPEPAPAPAPVTTPAPAPATAASTTDEPSGEWLASDWEDDPDEVDFPIADYDELTAGQILPLLPQLYADEIGVVEARERATKGRPEVLDRLAELRGDVTTSATASPAPAEGLDHEREDEPDDEPAVAPAAAAASPWAADDDWFPIEDYESLSAAQIRPLLGELDDEELGLVRDREMALGRRRSLLDEIDRRLTGAAPAPPPAPAPGPDPKSVAEPAPLESAPTEDAAAKKAAPAKKAPAKKAAAKKASKAPAKKAAAKKATPAKKAAPAKKATKKS